MSPLDVLKDSHASIELVWEASKQLFGKTILDWEPDTFALEFERQGVQASPSLMTKVLSAQTLLTTGVIFTDHEALFAFALANSGIAHTYDGFAHPTILQLVLAIHQIENLTKSKLTEDSGFDPDNIDPAIAVLLHDEGWYVAPNELSFCQPLLNNLSQLESKKIEQCQKAWKELFDKSNMKEVAAELPETLFGVQLRRLVDTAVSVQEYSIYTAEVLKNLIWVIGNKK